MKKIFLFALVLMFVGAEAFAQAKKPSLMVVPGDAWCNKNGYVQNFDNQGVTEVISDYTKALNTDMNMSGAIAKISAIMAERGFPLKDLQQTIKGINARSAERALLTSRSTGANVAESPLDRLKRTAKADIILDLNWEVLTTGPKKSVHFILKGIDAYTNEVIAASEGTGTPSFSAEIPVLLEEAVQDHMEAFCNGLQQHFEDMAENGRKITVEIMVFDDGSDLTLESDFDGYELVEIIDNWMAENSVEHRFNKADASENFVLYTPVHIPLFKANGMPQDADGFVRELSRFLKSAPYNIPTKVSMRGLGECVLVLGQK